MPSLIELALHPERRRPTPEPLAVSLRPVFAVGAGVWLVALVVVLVLWAVDRAPVAAVWTCATGVVLGAIGLLWSVRHDPTPR